MTLRTGIMICAFLLFSKGLKAQHNALLGPIALGQDQEVVAKHLSDQNPGITKVVPKSVAFPMARKAEEHWVLEGFKEDHGTLDRMVLTFADGELVFVQVSGGVNDWTEQVSDTAYSEYRDFRFYKEKGIVLKSSEDKAWLLNETGLHLNLFAWDHPMLNGESWPEYSNQVEVPDFLRMGARLDELEPLLQDASQFIYKQELDGSDPNADLQLDCFGVEYGGYVRKAEARFGKGQLNAVWILTAKEEESRLRALLKSTYGAPVFTSEDWEAYHGWQVFLRKDKPEILFLTEALGQYYKKEFFGQ